MVLPAQVIYARMHVCACFFRSVSPPFHFTSINIPTSCSSLALDPILPDIPPSIPIPPDRAEGATGGQGRVRRGVLRRPRPPRREPRPGPDPCTPIPNPPRPHPESRGRDPVQHTWNYSSGASCWSGRERAPPPPGGCGCPGADFLAMLTHCDVTGTAGAVGGPRPIGVGGGRGEGAKGVLSSCAHPPSDLYMLRV